jgi:hypothetical protein
MVSFQSKNPNLGKIWRSLDWKMFIYFIVIWNILLPLRIFNDHWVHFVFIWYIFYGFGIMCQEKSGNPVRRVWLAWTWSRIAPQEWKLNEMDVLTLNKKNSRQPFVNIELVSIFQPLFSIKWKEWGCQIILGTMYQGKWIPSDHKIKKMIIKYTMWS